MSYNPQNPLIVQSDRTVLLETANGETLCKEIAHMVVGGVYLENVLICPNATGNLLSVRQMNLKGWKYAQSAEEAFFEKHVVREDGSLEVVDT